MQTVYRVSSVMTFTLHGYQARKLQGGCLFFFVISVGRYLCILFECWLKEKFELHLSIGTEFRRKSRTPVFNNCTLPPFIVALVRSTNTLLLAHQMGEKFCFTKFYLRPINLREGGAINKGDCRLINIVENDITEVWTISKSTHSASQSLWGKDEVVFYLFAISFWTLSILIVNH